MAAISETGKITGGESRVLAETKKGFTYFERGDVLLAKITPCFENGKAVLLDELKTQIGFGSTEFHVLRPDPEKLDAKYLFYLVWNDQFRHAGEKNMTGSAGQKRVPAQFLKGFCVPLPPLETQKQIAAILEKADQLRKDCQQMEQELNNLAQSVFMDMFGKHLESGQFVNLGEVADVVSGVTKGQKLEGKKTQMVPYMRVANVQAGYLDLSEIKDIEVKLSDVDKYRLECGDMLLTEGGDFDKLGRGALWEGKIENCIHQNHVFRVRLDRDKYLPEWFNGFLQTDFAKRYFLKCAKKTTNLASINITQLKGLPMPTVGVDLQNSFFDKIKIIKEKRELASKAFCEHDQTFNSLMQKAFNGELNIKTKAA
jgi:type I restriction enzyme S subunit